MPRASPSRPLPSLQVGRAALQWWHGTLRIVHLGAVLGVLALSPSSYARPRRPRLASHLVAGVMPVLPWFAVVSALLSLVIARIVIVTAASYGLDQYALGMVVRVLVLELIPLTAALFVAVRIAVPASAELARLRRSAGVGPVLLRDEVAPRAAAALFAVLLLAALASVITLLLAYLLVHGFTPWGFERFTRQVGQVFTPAVSLIFVLKTLALGVAVAVIPAGSALHDRSPSPLSLELQGLVRLLLAVLGVEVASLVGNYA